MHNCGQTLDMADRNTQWTHLPIAEVRLPISDCYQWESMLQVIAACIAEASMSDAGSRAILLFCVSAPLCSCIY